MKLNFNQYKDKVKACWLGKNIGGTLGAPFECFRGVYDLEYYTHDISTGVLPNDDLDLQIVWLAAAEKYGRNVCSKILGEYWISYIVADWSEYGAGKNNMRFRLQPPISGWYKNHNKDSCGCFIRSEIWACLAPGQPEIAVRYAYEDAICDHADEGAYAEIFCAALQSAAFVERDMKTLTDCALSYIPEDCTIAKVIRFVYECYDKGLSWKEARKAILIKFPGSFGNYNGYKEDQTPEDDIPAGVPGYDAPSNIGLMMLGWIYGEGDFSKSICIAAGCCEDADCTAGTLGALLGIMGGTQIIDKKWLEPIGDEIKTISIDCTKMYPMNVPKTVTELSERVIKLMPTFMHNHFRINESGIFEFDEVQITTARTLSIGTFENTTFTKLMLTSPVCVTASCVLYDVNVVYDGNLTVTEGVPKHFRLEFNNRILTQQWLELKLHLPEEWTASPSRTMHINLNNANGGSAWSEFEFDIIPASVDEGRYDILLELTSTGRMTKTFMEMPLMSC